MKFYAIVVSILPFAIALRAAGTAQQTRSASPALRQLLGGQEPPSAPPPVAASPVRGLPGNVSFERLKALYDESRAIPSRDELDGWFAGSEVGEPNGADYARVYPAVLIGIKRSADVPWGLYRFICVACSGSEFREVRLPLVRRLQALLAEQGALFSSPSFSAGALHFDCTNPPQNFSLRKSGRYFVEKGLASGRTFYAVYYRDVTPGE